MKRNVPRWPVGGWSRSEAYADASAGVCSGIGPGRAPADHALSSPPTAAPRWYACTTTTSTTRATCCCLSGQTVYFFSFQYICPTWYQRSATDGGYCCCCCCCWSDSAPTLHPSPRPRSICVSIRIRAVILSCCASLSAWWRAKSGSRSLRGPSGCC